MKHKLIFAPVVLALLLSGCGFNLSRDLRLAILAAPPLIETLPLSPALKSGLITDFTDIAGRVADLGDCLKAGDGKPADLICVQTLQGQVETIISRGNFGSANNEKLQRILSLIRGIIASARIYYGDGSATPSLTGEVVTEDSIKAQIRALKAEMRVE